MRKVIATIAVLGLMWIGYVAWPLYDLYVLARAFETRDVATVVRHVYFDSVRRSLADQIVAAYLRRAGVQLGPLAQGAVGSALGIADPVLSKVMSPEALSEFLSTGWPVAVAPDVPAGTLGISSKTLGNAWQVFAASEYGIGRFYVALPQSLPPPQRLGLAFRLLQWRWQLTGITLPENIQNLLADALIKAMKERERKP
jgi:hypothetical protein